MNYKQRDDELIRRKKERIAKDPSIGMNKELENRSYTGKGLDALAKGEYKTLSISSTNRVPELKPTSTADKNYVVKRDRYSTLMQNNDLANGVKTLAQINYNNANQDATVSEDWANTYGARAITGGMTKDEYIKDLSRKYGLSSKELNDMAFTFHSDATKQETAKYGKDLEKVGKAHPILGSLGSFVGTLGRGVEGIYNNAVGAITGDDRFLSDMFQKTKESPREGVKQNFKSDAAKNIYDLGMGIGDMGAGALTGNAAAILAGNTAADAQESAQNRGQSVRKSSIYGLGAGALDYITENIGLGNAENLAANGIKNAGVKQFLKNSALAGKEELKENVIQSLGQSVLDAIMNGSNSELNLSYQNKMANGMDSNDAFWQTALEYGEQLGLDAALGFGMGSTMHAGASLLPSLRGMMGGRNNTPDIPDNNIPAVTGDATIDNAIKQTVDAEAEIQRLSEQIPKVPEVVNESAPTLTPEEQAALQTELANEGFDWSEGQADTPNNVESFNGYKVGDKVTYSTDDFDGKSSTESTIKEVYPDHMIVDVPGLSDHVWIDNDTMDMVKSSKSNNPITKIDQIKEGIKAKDFRPVTFVNNEGHTYIISKSTRPGEKWQLSHIDDTGRPKGHSAFSNDNDLLATLDKVNTDNIANVGGDTILNQGRTTIGDMLNNPDDYSLDDFKRAVRAYDTNADVDGVEKEDIIAFFNNEAEGNPDVLTSNIPINRLVNNNTSETNTNINESASKNPTISSKPIDKTKPIKDQLSPEDRASIFGGTRKGKRIQGLTDSIGYAKKFAGDTAEAKQLAKEAKALIESYVESGSTDDYITLLKKIEDLDNLARETRADYTTKKGDVFTYDNYFTDFDDDGNEIPSSLLDQFVGNSALSKSVKAVHDALADTTSTPTTSMDPAHELAGRYAAAYQGFDTYDYMDNIFENDSFEESMANDIQNGRDLTGYIDALEEIIDDAPDEGTRAEMQSLIDELTTLNEGRVPTDGQLTPEEVSRLQDISDGKEDIPETGNEVPNVKPTEPTPPVPPSNNEVPEVKGKVRSFSKRGSMDDTLPDEVRNVLKKDYYKVVRNADTAEKANSLFDENDLVQTRSNLEQLLEKKDPASALLSYKLAGAYVDAKQYDAATDVLRQVSEKLTEAGQFTQAAKLAMVKNDPMAALRMYQRDLDNLNQWGKDKYGKKWEKIKLTDEDKAAFKNIKAGDSEALSSLVDTLNGRFSKQIPSTLWDKIVGATKTSMLLNPRTQFRNVGANMAFLPLRSVSDRVSAIGQNITHLINPNVKVTQSLKGGNKAQKDIAGKIFDNMRSDILNENKMKDSTKSDILSRRQTFNDDFFATWVNNLTNGGIEKLNKKFGADANKSTMETLQNFTYWLMGDVGDVPFVKKNFVNRLASYMDAQGITNIDDVPDDAIALATQEALKATFKDDNAFTKALQGVKQKTGKFGEVALPFTKTPANLAVRAYDYSPLGIISTLKKAKSGADVSEVIDDLSKNLTGTAMILLGIKLREKGILSGNYSEDNKDEAAAQKRQGMLENAFHIGGKYYTYDWAQPAATPLVLGSVISDAMKASDDQNKEAKDIVNATYKGAIKVGNTIINSSPLQSLSDMLGGDSYSDGPAGSIAEEIIEFPQRFIPSVLGATARVKDPVIRETYSNDGGLTGILKSQIDTAKSKIPELSKTLPASYDTWGQERRRSNSTGEAAFAQYVNPGQFGVDTSIPIDKDIQAIYDKTGNADVFPKYAPRSLDLGNDGTIKLDNKQHSEYQKELGQLSRKFAEGLFANSEFKKLSDDEKAKMLGNAYNFANVMSKEKLFDHVTDSDKKLKEAYKSNGVNGAIKYWIDKSKADELGITYDTYVKKEAEQPGSAAQYAQDKQKLDAINDKYGTNIQMSTLEKYGENGAEQRAQGTIEAKNYGFVDKEGNANVDAYTKAVDMFGNDQKSLRAYSDFHKQGLKKNAQMIPALMNNNQFTDKQKGQVIMAEHGYKYDDLGNTAKGAYDREGEAGVYYFYLLKNLADTQYGDGNGSVKKAEKVALMNSDNPNVTKLSDDMYYYLGNAKW